MAENKCWTKKSDVFANQALEASTGIISGPRECRAGTMQNSTLCNCVIFILYE